MRIRTVACACLLVAASVGGAKTLAAASPDCARWIKEYQQGLARHAVLGKKHVVKAAHRLIVPRPHLQHASLPLNHVRPPKLSPAEMLKRFRVLCGEDLPDEVLPAVFQPTGLEDTLLPETDLPDDNTLAGLTGNGGASPFTPDAPVPPVPPPVPPVTDTPVGPPIIPIIPGTPTPTPIPAPVPEPGTLVLLLTGLGTLPAVIRARRKGSAA